MKTPKTRNAGTQTEAAFFSMLRSALRRLSFRWKPIQAAKNAQRVPYTGTNKRRKWLYRCEVCKGLFHGTNVQVDHNIPAGALTSVEDLPGFVSRLFAESGFTLLCKACHQKKTNDERRK